MRKSAVAALLPLVTTTFLTLPSLANELEVSNLLQREDIKSLPKPLQNQLVQLIEQPHAFREAAILDSFPFGQVLRDQCP